MSNDLFTSTRTVAEILDDIERRCMAGECPENLVDELAEACGDKRRARVYVDSMLLLAKLAGEMKELSQEVK